jgi:hypothetical protein
MKQNVEANGPITTRRSFTNPISSELNLWNPRRRTNRNKIGDRKSTTAHIAMPRTNLRGENTGVTSFQIASGFRFYLDVRQC